jgi:transposase
MKQPVPRITQPPAELKRLLTAETDGQKHQRLQALYLLQPQQARTRHQAAPRLGVHRHTVRRWLAAYARGGRPQLLTMAKAPGQSPRLSEAAPQALRERLAQPQGFASCKAIWHWLRQAYRVPIAYKPVHKLVRYRLHAKLKVPRKSPLKNP